MLSDFFALMWKHYFGFLVFTVAFAIFVIVIIAFVTYRQFSKQKEEMEKEKKMNALLSKAMSRSVVWLLTSVLWQALEYLGVLIPFEASCIILLTNSLEQHSAVANIVYSAISMIFVVLFYSINPRKHVRGYRKAYNITDGAINNYILEENSKKLQKAMKRAEDAINEAYDVEVDDSAV